MYVCAACMHGLPITATHPPIDPWWMQLHASEISLQTELNDLNLGQQIYVDMSIILPDPTH